MRTFTVGTLLAVVSGAALALVGTSPAGALDCMEPAEATPEEFADGTAMLHPEMSFTDSGVYALIGEVTGHVESTRSDPPGPPRQVQIRVAAAIGRESIEPTMVVDNDEEWGWRWPIGERRLFVVWAPDDRPPVLDLCHGGIGIADPEALAAELEPIAAANSVPFAVPDPEVADTSGATSGSSSGRGALVAAAGIAAVGLVGGAIVVMRRSRPVAADGT